VGKNGCEAIFEKALKANGTTFWIYGGEEKRGGNRTAHLVAKTLALSDD